MKRFYILILALLSVVCVSAQITGCVVDANTGDSIGYASIKYKNQKVSTIADAKGFYTIARRNGYRLIFSAVGYKEKSITITDNVSDKLMVKLVPSTKQLKELVVNSKKKGRYSRKNNPAVELMRRVIAKKRQNSLETNPYYSFKKYQKITVALNDISPSQIEWSEKKQSRQWLLDHVEVCPYNNKLIMPISINETVEEKIYRKNPESSKTYLDAEKRQGLNMFLQTGDIVNELVKDIFADIHIYDNQIKVLRHPFTSPIADNAISFYRYYITDTTFVGNDRCIRVDFTPNNQQDFGFRGTVYVLYDSTLQVRRCELTIPTNSDVNFVEQMKCEQEFSRLGNGEWGLTKDNIFVELYLVNFAQKAIVLRDTRMDNFSFAAIDDARFKPKGSIIKNPKAKYRDDQYWAEQRQVSLTKTEGSMGSFMDRLEKIKGFHYILLGVKLLFENYLETGGKDSPSYFDIGAINTFISQNFYDGMRLRFGGQTTAALNPHWFFNGYYARGLASGQGYYNAEFAYSFNEKEFLPREYPKRTITFNSMRDVAYASDKYNTTDKDNIFHSFKAFKMDKMFLYNRQKLDFEYEIETGWKFQTVLKAEKMSPIGNLEFRTVGAPEVSDIPDGNSSSSQLFDNIRTTELTATIRFAPGEKYINSKSKRMLVNLDAPVFLLQHTFGINNFLGGQYNYNISEFEFFKRFWLPHAWGRIDGRIKIGAQWNKVPYPLLIMPASNISYILDKQSFNIINNMEFMNDRYLAAHISWDMSGKIFNRIPLLKKLKWREFMSARMLWGCLTDKNNPQYYLDHGIADGTVMVFPEGSYAMDSSKPYFEVSFGIQNIFRLFHIEYVRRLSYLDLPTASKRGIRFTMSLNF